MLFANTILFYLHLIVNFDLLFVLCVIPTGILVRYCIIFYEVLL